MTDSIIYQCGGLLAPYALDMTRYQPGRFEPGEDGDFAVFFYLKDHPEIGIRIFGRSDRRTGKVLTYQLEFL